MSDTLSEAERLLNTIVSSRVRLASLRGDPTHPEPASDGSLAQRPPAAAPSADFAEQATEDDALENADSEPADVSQNAIVLGMPVADETEPIEPLFADDLFDGFQSTNPALGETTDAEPDETSSPMDDGSDPFSFIDLIPSKPNDPPEETAASSLPPPVRAAPSMPLPTALAVGAPAAPAPVASLEPAPHADGPMPPEALDAIEVIEPMSAYELASPRPVAPTVLDPDRDRLDVEVIERDSAQEPWAEPADTRTAPRLTEPTARPARRTDTAGSSPDEAVFDALSGAHDALRRGASSEASRLLTDALDWAPNHFEARLLRGRCARDAGDQLAALSDFQWAMEIAPQSPLAHVEIGDLFFAKKDYIQAIQHYTNALDRDPNHAMALCRRGICHHYKRQPERALDDLQSAAQINPEIANIDRYIRMVAPRPTR